MRRPKRTFTAMTRICDAMSSQSPDWAGMQQRIEAMRRLYIRIARDDAMSSALKAAVTNAVSVDADGTRFEGRFITVFGASGAGKTSLVSHALADLTGFEDFPEAAGMMMPVVCIEATRPASSKSLATGLLTAMGVPHGRRVTTRIAWDMARESLANRQVILVAIDEAQHCLRDGDEEAQLARDELKSLTQGSWPVTIILTGLGSLDAFVREDSQIMRRATFVELSPLDRKEDRDLVSAMLSELINRAQLTLDVPPGYDVVDRLACAGCLQIGRIATIVALAAESALANGAATLGIGHLAQALQDIALCGDDHNAFLVAGAYDQIVLWPDDPRRRRSATDIAPSSLETGRFR